MKKYIVFQMTNTKYEKLEEQLVLLKSTFGENNFQNDCLYAFGVCGPMLLTQSAKEMSDAVNLAFDLAEKYNIPVYFQMDDITNYTTEFGSGAEKWYENEAMTEKTGFGAAPSARFWFNWGIWQYSPAVPCLNSPEFITFITSQLQTGVISALTKRVEALRKERKSYLFAGTAIGWETHIPNYTPGAPIYNISADNPPSFNGSTMTQGEMGQTGYRALENLGYDAEKLAQQATEEKISQKRLIYNLLTQVQQSFTATLAKQLYDSGIERTKIFTHIVVLGSSDNSASTNIPNISTAVNDYSTPGFTMSPVTCPYNINTLKRQIKRLDATQQYFANAEGYCAGVKDSVSSARDYFNELFDNGALVVTVFGYTDPEGSLFGVPKDAAAPFNVAVKEFLE